MSVPTQAAVDLLSTIPLAAHLHGGTACVAGSETSTAVHDASCSHHPGEEVKCVGHHIPFFGTMNVCVHHVSPV